MTSEPDPAPSEAWELEHEGRHHIVSMQASGVSYTFAWTVDGVEVAQRKDAGDKVVLSADGFGAVALQIKPLRGLATRVRHFDDTAEAHVGVGGTDFAPRPGSRAAEREDWIRKHPRLHALRSTGGAAAGVLVPMLVVLVWKLIPWPDLDLPRIPWPDIPWPDIKLPRIPWPDIPWPDIPWPDISWPDLNLPALPPWVELLVKVLFAVLVAYVVARGEIKRRRDRATRQ